MAERVPRAAARHLIGRVEGRSPGPVLICLGGIHGNEPAGVQALEQVASRLQDYRGSIRGRWVALSGNLTALSAGRRYMERDLNRVWIRDSLPNRPPPAQGADRREQEELLQALQSAREGAGREVFFLDLHTSSADGPPFAIINDRLENRAFARRFPLPLVLGFEEELQGTLADYMDSLGCVSVGFEAGRHDSPASREYLESIVWIALEASGLLPGGEIPDLDRHVKRLASASGPIPPVVEVRYRHVVGPEDDFQMRPGYRNFQKVEAGELLARDRTGALMAPQRGLILLPLYQARGEDGFFIGVAVSPFWLNLSARFRSWPLDRFLHWLPGIRRLPGAEEALVVSPWAARCFAVEIFHLLGFRRRKGPQGQIFMTRRR